MICPNCHTPLTPAGKIDQRTTRWRMRVRLYAAPDMGEPVCDTDAESAHDAPGATIVTGLPAMCEELQTLAYAFHTRPGRTVAGLDMETLDHRLKSLRPTLYRETGNSPKGHGVWRVPYTVDGEAWLARVDVERADQ